MKNSAYEEIVLSSRIRLARNLSGRPFVNNASLAIQRDIRDKTAAVLEQDGYGTMNMDGITAVERQMLVEKHMISRELAANSQSGAVCLSRDKHVAIMINEEDHIRIQAINDGLKLEEELEAANAADTYMQHSGLTFAHHNDLGYLTCCPTNVGTGMRASAMIHLPALVMSNKIQSVIESVSKLGITVRGMYGEGSKAEGNIFQISNRVTLGVTQKEILATVKNMCDQIVGMETEMRELLLKSNRAYVSDRVFRAYGTLTNAYILKQEEAMQLLSDLKLGIGLELLSVGEEHQISSINGLIENSRTAVLLSGNDELKSQEEQDIMRAKIIREGLEGISAVR